MQKSLLFLTHKDISIAMQNVCCKAEQHLNLLLSHLSVLFVRF